MKIFLDSVDLIAIDAFSSFGIIDGVTTNPSLMSSSDLSFSEIVKEISSRVCGDISIEVVSDNYDNMVKEGNKILDINSDLVIKLPISWDGIRACKYFSDKRVKVNMTLCFSLNQAILVAKAGATYVSPFVGRLEDIGEDGIGLIADIRSVYDNYNIETKILAASIRNLGHIEEVAVCGSDVVTVPAELLSEMVKHDLTDTGLRKFKEDWVKSGKKI